MCVIITSSKRHNRPSIEILRACAEANDDGSGLAWVQNKEVHYIKGMGVEQIHKSIQQVDGEVVIHFRIASVGGVHPRLCHPFPITQFPEAKEYGKASAVLFHNGTWHLWERWAKEVGLELDGPVSDSRVAAAYVEEYGFEALGKTGSRWAMLEKNGDVSHLGEWWTVDGNYYSNTFWVQRFNAARKRRAAAEVFEFPFPS